MGEQPQKNNRPTKMLTCHIKASFTWPVFIGLFCSITWTPVTQASIDGLYYQQECLDCRLDIEPVWIEEKIVCFGSVLRCFKLKPFTFGRWHFLAKWSVEDGYDHRPLEVLVLGQVSEDGALTFNLTHRYPVAETLDSYWLHGLARYQQK